MHKKLPSKPSRLIEIALEDLKKTERSPKFYVNMDHWLKKRGDRCAVCFAGSVLAHRTAKDWVKKKLKDNNSHAVEDWGNCEVKQEAAYCALDSIRKYEFICFLEECSIHSRNKSIKNKIDKTLEKCSYCSLHQFNPILKGIKKVPYHRNKTVFKRNMRTIANRLKKLGL